MDASVEEPEIEEDPEIRRAKTVLFTLTFGSILILILILLLFFQPEGQVIISRYPNGYPKTRTHFVQDLAEKGRAIKVGDQEDSYNTGLRQFLDEKSYKPTYEPFKLGSFLDEGAK